VFAAVVFSTLFLYAYLSIFDWRLIWIIDYSDIFKVGLVAVAVLSSVIIVLLAGLQTLLGVFELKERARTRQIWFLIILGVLVLGSWLFLQWWQPAPYEWYKAWLSAAIFVLLICFVIARIITHGLPITAHNIVLLCGFTVTTAAVAGSTFGTVTKYSGGLRYNVFAKDNLELVDVRMVLFTAHHVVFYSGNQVIVLPTADIVRIVGHPMDQEQK
jgi:hypothetical protein